MEFDAVIGKDGKIDELHVVSGHPLLTGAAADAVRLWEYKVPIVNGRRAMIKTKITITFSLH